MFKFCTSLVYAPRRLVVRVPQAVQVLGCRRGLRILLKTRRGSLNDMVNLAPRRNCA